jgi:hypothetical protein
MVSFGVNTKDMASVKDYKGTASLWKSSPSTASGQMNLYNAQLDHVLKAQNTVFDLSTIV